MGCLLGGVHDRSPKLLGPLHIWLPLPGTSREVKAQAEQCGFLLPPPRGPAGEEAWAPGVPSRQLIPEPLHPAPRSARRPAAQGQRGDRAPAAPSLGSGVSAAMPRSPGAACAPPFLSPRVTGGSGVGGRGSGVGGRGGPPVTGFRRGRRDKGRDTISTLRGRPPSTSFHRGPNEREASFLGRAGAAGPGSEIAGRAGAGVTGLGHPSPGPAGGAPGVGTARRGLPVSPAGLHLQAAPSAGPQQLGRRAPEAAYSPQRRHVAAADGGGGRAEVPPRAPGSPACAPREGRAPSAQRGRHLGSWRGRPPELDFRVCASASRRLKGDRGGCSLRSRRPFGREPWGLEPTRLVAPGAQGEAAPGGEPRGDGGAAPRVADPRGASHPPAPASWLPRRVWRTRGAVLAEPQERGLPKARGAWSQPPGLSCAERGGLRLGGGMGADSPTRAEGAPRSVPGAVGADRLRGDGLAGTVRARGAEDTAAFVRLPAAPPPPRRL